MLPNTGAPDEVLLPPSRARRASRKVEVVLFVVAIIIVVAVVLAAVFVSADEEADIRERRVARDLDLKR